MAAQEQVLQKVDKVERELEQVLQKIDKVERETPHDRDMLLVLSRRLATLEEEKLLLMKQATPQHSTAAAGSLDVSGAGSLYGLDGSVGAAEVAKQLRESRREQRRMRQILEEQSKNFEEQGHMLKQHLGFLSFGPAGSSHPRTSVYKPTSFDAYCGDDWEQAPELRCLLTGKLYPADSVIAAHIFRHQWKDRAALIQAGINIDGPANVIPCHKNVEKNLDAMRVTIEPTTPGQFTIKVMDPKLLTPGHQYIVDKDDGMRWSDISNKEIDLTYRDFGTRGAPLSALVCAIHMRSAILTAENYMWMPKGSVKIPKWAQGLLSTPTGILEEYLKSAVQSAEASGSPTHSSSTSSSVGELQETAPHSMQLASAGAQST